MSFSEPLVRGDEDGNGDEGQARVPMDEEDEGEDEDEEKEEEGEDKERVCNAHANGRWMQTKDAYAPKMVPQKRQSQSVAYLFIGDPLLPSWFSFLYVCHCVCPLSVCLPFLARHTLHPHAPLSSSSSTHAPLTRFLQRVRCIQARLPRPDLLPQNLFPLNAFLLNPLKTHTQPKGKGTLPGRQLCQTTLIPPKVWRRQGTFSFGRFHGEAQ